MRSVSLVPAALAVVLPACASMRASNASAESIVRYTCAGGVNLTTTKRANGDLAVEWNGRTWTLTRTTSGVGEVWTDGNLQFRTRGQDVYLEERGTPVVRDCQVWR